MHFFPFANLQVTVPGGWERPSWAQTGRRGRSGNRLESGVHTLPRANRFLSIGARERLEVGRPAELPGRDPSAPHRCREVCLGRMSPVPGGEKPGAGGHGTGGSGTLQPEGRCPRRLPGSSVWCLTSGRVAPAPWLRARRAAKGGPAPLRFFTEEAGAGARAPHHPDRVFPR